MNTPAAIRCINNARLRNAVCSQEAHGEVECLLKMAAEALRPDRYVPLAVSPHFYILDTQHPDYSAEKEPSLGFAWVVLRWTHATEREREKAIDLLAILNSTAKPNE